jgi:hypothetical protein|tara:strand:+ start:9375 stop:9722 length:348 start_codon:yes stop_codon:yes gene_type:complete
MTKKRAIISYDKLEIEQKKGILKEYPDGYMNHLTQIKTPMGEIHDALIWETEETIYLVKFPKVAKAIILDDDDDEDDDMDEIETKDVKGDDDDIDDDDDEESFDKPEDDTDDDED